MHQAIRRHRVPFEDLTLIHLDAHPDLSASATMPAETVFASPHDVYLNLRSDSGGIAQWILPAVYGGHLRCVWWIRPTWAEQIADGDYNVFVGRASTHSASRPDSECEANTKRGGVSSAVRQGMRRRVAPVLNAGSLTGEGAPNCRQREIGGGSLGPGEAVRSPPSETIMISCAEPYFVEDGIYCKDEELMSPKPLRLLVSQLTVNGDMPLLNTTGGASSNACEASGWISGSTAHARPWILDVCLDFFACGNPFLNQVRQSIAAPFAAVQNRAVFRQGPVTDVAQFLGDRDAFDATYSAMLRGVLAEFATSVATIGDDHISGAGGVDVDAASTDGDSDVTTGGLVAAMGPFLPPDACEALLADLREALAAARESELQQILEAGDMVTLPLHPGSDLEVKRRLAEFDVFVCRLIEDVARGPPAVVTIARSVVDGFCPMRWHLALEGGVLEIVQRRLGPLQVVYSDELDALENA